MSNEYVLLSKAAKCSQYNKEITLTAKYHFTENPDNPHEIHFSRATCPIIENSKLSKDEQCEEYKYLDCFNPCCPLLTDFPSIWDSRNPL